MSDPVIITPGDDRVIITTGASGSVIIKQGEIGPAGVPGLVWRGTWASGTSYVLDDVVYYNGSAWVASTSVGPDIPPPASGNITSSYWQVIVRGWPVTITVSSTPPPNPLFDDVWIQV